MARRQPVWILRSPLPKWENYTRRKKKRRGNVSTLCDQHTFGLVSNIAYTHNGTQVPYSFIAYRNMFACLFFSLTTSSSILIMGPSNMYTRQSSMFADYEPTERTRQGWKSKRNEKKNGKWKREKNEWGWIAGSKRQWQLLWSSMQPSNASLGSSRFARNAITMAWAWRVSTVHRNSNEMITNHTHTDLDAKQTR